MLKEQYQNIMENINNACIKSGRNADEIEVVGITKTVDIERINKSIALGISHIGENKAQEFLEKYEDLKDKNIKFSFVGRLQTNKVKYIADKVDLIQSVDSIRLARVINENAKKINRVMDILVQINIAGEETKGGIFARDLEKLLYEMAGFSHIKVKGIMSIPPILTDEMTQRAYFSKLYKVFIDIKNESIDNIDMDILSMGMSDDYYYAILEGANMVRIGTKLYGKR